MSQEKTLDEVEGTAEQLELPLESEVARNFLAAGLRDELDLVPVSDFARAINVEPQTLAGWRAMGQGPGYAKLGKSVFYRREDIVRWIDRHIVYTGDDPAPAQITTREAA